MKLSVETIRHRKDFDGQKHYHRDTYEFYYMETGACTFLIDGTLYSVQEGDLVFIPPEVVHVASYTAPHSRLLIVCHRDLLRGVALPRVGVFRNPTVTQSICNLFSEAEWETRHADRYTEAVLEGIPCRLVALMMRHPNLYSEMTRGLVAEVLKEINDGFEEDLTLQEIAKRHGITPAHLSRCFKREAGMNFNRYLSLLRLKKAEQLLREEPSRSVGEIAFSCGFNDSNYFSEKFRSAYGCSPSAFRKNHLN